MYDMQPTGRFSVTLSNDAPLAPWTPIYLEVSKQDHRHRIAFLKNKPMKAVFCRELVELLTPILEDFDDADGDGMYTNPDAALQLPGLKLQQLRVIYYHRGNQPARALVSFSGFAGNPHRALLGEDSVSNPLEALTSQVYRDALDRVLLPALNILGLDEMDAFDGKDSSSLENAMASLRASKEQLLFQVELVKRELGRLEERAHSRGLEQRGLQPRALQAAEPPQEEFRTLKAIRDMS